MNRRELGALLVPILAGMEGDYHGHAGIRRWWGTLTSSHDFAAEVVEVGDLGDVTLATMRIRGHGADSDAPLWSAARWRRAKYVRWGAYGTEADALEATGLPE